MVDKDHSRDLEGQLSWLTIIALVAPTFGAGRTAVAIASGATLLLAGLIVAFAPGNSRILLVIALSLFGIYWILIV